MAERLKRIFAFFRHESSVSGAQSEATVSREDVEQVHAGYADVDHPRNLRVGTLPEDVVAALRKSKMDDRHAHLDDLMQD
jgi:hypothetical protein